MHKTIALVAHDHKEPDLVKWSLAHKAELSKHKLVATGTTGGKFYSADLTVNKWFNADMIKVVLCAGDC